MTIRRTTGNASLSPRTIARQLALAAAGALLAGLCHGQSPPASPAPARCASASPSVSNCKPDATNRDADGWSSAEPDDAAAADRDDLDRRAGQLETMNQQLRMEKRRKDSLLRLYPDEAALNAARARELAEKDKPIRAAEDRIDDLTRERKRLGDAAALYAGKPVPADLRNQTLHIDNALMEARAALRNGRDEKLQAAKTYDDELGVLRKLWAAQRKS